LHFALPPSARRVYQASRALVVGDLPVAFGGFVSTVGTCCPAAAEACVDPGAIVPSLALLDAMAETIRVATPGAIPDAAVGQAVTDAVARGRDQAIAGQGAALHRELRGILHTLRRAVARGGIERATGSQLLDLVRRARALALRS
jgi:hypothetical protein